MRKKIYFFNKKLIFLFNINEKIILNIKLVHNYFIKQSVFLKTTV
jgi:hypothetical protein